MYSIFKFFIFKISAEKAHHVTMKGLIGVLKFPFVKFLFQQLYGTENQSIEIKKLGLTFKNKVGLAAGFDKDGKYVAAMQHLGFGFVEIGTVTPRPQSGNPTPRLFRLPSDKALINRMGFNNDGADVLATRLANFKDKKVILGINIGKNKDTPNEAAEEDYVYCFEKLFEFADYFVVNVSSPNTPNLRALQDREPLLRLLNRLQTLNFQKSKPKPILLKIAPDLTFSQLDDVIEVVKTSQIAGIVATNTTIERSHLSTSSDEIERIGAGGLSGQPVKEKSTEVIRYLRKGLPTDIVIMGVGGIQKAKDAQEKLDVGADLVQVYTGFIYEGPKMVKRIVDGLK
jgi:dihydroorotate dehydrogenase